MGIFQDYYASKTRQAQQGTAALPQPTEQPQIDTSNAIASLAQLMGPTPAEREAQERRLQESRAKMQGWTAFFDGMRQLGNLYYTTKGARPQQFNDNPYQLVENAIQSERKRVDDLANYRRQYAAALYNLRRQANEDIRKSLLAAAQAKYYDTRDEVARMKAENDRLKSEKYVELQDGRIAKMNAETGKIEELLPLQKREIESRITKNDRTGLAAMARAGRSGGRRSGGTYGYRTTKHIDPETGDVITERVPTTGNNQTPTTTVKKKTKKTGSSGATNNSGFFNK